MEVIFEFSSSTYSPLLRRKYEIKKDKKNKNIIYLQMINLNQKDQYQECLQHKIENTSTLLK